MMHMLNKGAWLAIMLQLIKRRYHKQQNSPFNTYAIDPKKL